MNFTVFILAHSSCALTDYLLFYSRPSWWKSWQCFSSWEYGRTLTLILSLWLINFLWILCEFYLILSLFQAPGSETVVQSFGKMRGAWGRSGPPPPPCSNRRARLLFACYIFATSLGTWHRLYHSLSRRRFEDVIFSPSSLVGRKEIQLSLECLPAAVTSCTHVLPIYHKRKWEINLFL